MKHTIRFAALAVAAVLGACSGGLRVGRTAERGDLDDLAVGEEDVREAEAAADHAAVAE